MKHFIKPNFKKSNICISSSLAEFLHAPNDNYTLKILNKELSKNYKNVVFMCLDGMGIYPLKANLDRKNYLRKNIKRTLLSTFPSTTTNATTSLLTNKLPLEHGWFGWSVNFDNINKNVNIFMNADSWTGEKLEIDNSPLMKLDYYFDNAKTDYNINTVFPCYVKVKNENRNNIFSSLNEYFGLIKSICRKPNKQFIYAYLDEPDYSMHINGVKSEFTKKLLKNISEKVQDLVKSTKNTLFIITADHGQVDVTEYFELYKDEEILDMLKIYPYLEQRAVAFKVKDDMCDAFVKVFNSKYGKDFKLYKSDYLLKKGYFGKCGDKASLLGDYIAVGKFSHKCMLLTPTNEKLMGHHTSLTEEMKVPLIILKN